MNSSLWKILHVQYFDSFGHDFNGDLCHNNLSNRQSEVLKKGWASLFSLSENGICSTEQMPFE